MKNYNKIRSEDKALQRLQEFKEARSHDKERYIQLVQKNLKDHQNALNSIGMGYCIHVVQAGNVFLRIVNKL